jgi:arabinogalactan endo-1,4-beta-galactosidase
MKRIRRCLSALLSVAAFTAFSAAAAKPFWVGVDANYSLGMEQEGREWRWEQKPAELFKGMAAQGVKSFRVRLWTGDDGVNGKHYATRVVKRAQAAGLDPYLVIFLSEDWADLMKQPAPAIWKNLDLPARAKAVRAYSRDIVTHFRKEGLTNHLYEIGNEIDYGICGVYPGKSTKKTPEGLGREHWPQAAELILASQQGVKEADPEAKFMLHIAHWWDVDFCIGFFRFMLGKGVQIDYAGLSYFPSSNIGGSLEMEQFGDVVTRLHQAVGCPVIVPETAYPSTSDFKGQFSRWKKETPGYPLSPDGQRRWIGDFLGYCAAHPDIAAVYYWSPEWCGEGMWKAFALFDPAGEAKSAWSAFSADPAKRGKPKTSVYFEAAGDRIVAVPLDEAKRRAVEILTVKLKEAGRVNVGYIQTITAEKLVVKGYRVNLRASLSGNLDLLLEEAGAAPEKPVIETINPVTERIVLFTRGPETLAVTSLLALAKTRGIEVIVHPVAADKALKFGLGNDWQKAGGEEPADTASSTDG